MSKPVWNRYFFGLAIITSLALLIWIAGTTVAAQNPTTGTWTASISSKDDSKIQLNLERRSDKGGRHQSGRVGGVHCHREQHHGYRARQNHGR